jgi:hypothetical protein
MRIRILGNGGFDNEGLPFNSFLMDDRILVETPPDILQSLRRESIPLASIETVIITHFHGDHCFGLPFFIFNMAKALGNPPSHGLTIAGPQGLRERAEQLLGLAISFDSPYLRWFREKVRLVEIDGNTSLDLGRGLWARFMPTDHPVPTFAVLAGMDPTGTQPLFAATSDTAWGSKVASVFACGARLFLCDVNGVPGSQVHMSAQDVVERGLPLVKAGTQVVGTHLSTDNQPEIPGLRIARPGDILEVE